MKFIPEILFIVLIAIYSLVITRYIPKKYYSFSNLVISLGAICYGLLIGLNQYQLGLTVNSLIRGSIFGAVISLPIIICILLAVSIKKLRSHFSNTPKKNYNKRVFCYELLFRIPFGTALSEEVIFRSVLLAILLTNHPKTTALIIVSVLFGLWHIFPTLHTVKDHDPLIEMMDSIPKRNLIAVLSSVLATTLAGAAFTMIALFTGSFIASWIVHSSINGFATLGGYLAVWHENRKSN